MDHFVTDRRKTLIIMKEIFSHFEQMDDISINCNFDCDYIYSSDDSILDHFIQTKHVVRVAEIYIDDKSDILTPELLYNGSLTVSSDQIEIYGDSRIERGKIELTAYLHNTQVECDVSFASFTYNCKYKMWIIFDASWDAKNGIDCTGHVTILDMSMYSIVNILNDTLSILPISFLQPVNELL